MKAVSLSLVVAVVVLVGAGSAVAITVPMSDSTYIPFTDMLGFNWRILAAKGVVPEVPHLPTGMSVPFPRMFSNGNPNPNVDPLSAPVVWPPPHVSAFNPDQSAEFWWGLEYTGGHGHNPLVVDVGGVLTAGQVLDYIRLLDPTAVTPVFAFDQNQTGEQPKDPDDLLPGWDPGFPVYDRDIWLRGRVILLDPAAVPGTEGLAGLEGLTPAEVNAIVDPLIAGGDPRVQVFSMYDDYFNDFPPGWIYLPGIYEMEGYTVNNNIGAHAADWGGYFPMMDLSYYTDWAFFVELQSQFNNDGKEEGYIVGGMPPIPEPLTMVGLLAAVGTLSGYLRKRLR